MPNPKNPLTNILTSFKGNGVIVYEIIQRNGNPVSVQVPQVIYDKLKQLAIRLKNNLANADYEITSFLRQNPELITYIKNAALTTGVAIIVGTIVEDFFTAGVGIADDWACFLVGYKVIRLALTL